MIHEPITIADPPPATADAGLRRWHESGAALGRTHRDTRPRGRTRVAVPNRRRRVQDLIARVAADSRGENAAWILDNFRLILGAEKEVRKFAIGMREFRAINDPSGAETPRVCLLARRYLEAGGHAFSEQEVTAFLEGYQETADLEIGEIWALKPALQLELVDRLTRAEASEWPVLLTSLRRIGETAWKDLVEAASHTHHVLARDPAGAYSRMDFDSRDRYRKELADLARHSAMTEPEVAEAAIDLCQQAGAVSDGSRAAVRRTHVGFYLVDRGRSRTRGCHRLPPILVGARSPVHPAIPNGILPGRN